MAWDFLPSTYDTVAEIYEARFLDELEERPRDRELLEAFAGSVHGSVVEIGCGPGHIGAFVQDFGRPVLGVDLSPGMAARAASRLSGVTVADMRSLPLPDARVGGVLAFYSLIHLRRIEVPYVLADLHRVLRHGGSMLMAAHKGNGEVVLDEFVGEPVPFAVTLFEPEELAEAMRAVGFEITLAEVRAPIGTETTHRIYVAARKP